MKKMLNPNDKEFENELSLLKSLRHPNFVILYGMYIDPETNEKFICTEFLALGGLDKFLKEYPSLSFDTLLSLAIGSCAGMNYLSRNNIVHRDLAARNLLVTRGEDNILTAKVTDFGLSRSVSEGEYESTSKLCPIKWTAPEAIMYQKFTTRSDVWSFGIVLWEIFESGKTPYPGMSNKEALDFVKSGGRLEKPSSLNGENPSLVYSLMLKCWDDDPEKRPLFDDIYIQLSDIRKNDSGFRETRRAPVQNDKIPLPQTTYYSTSGNKSKSVYYVISKGKSIESVNKGRSA